MKIGQAIDSIFEDKSKSYEGTINGFKYVLQFDEINIKIITKGPFGAVMESGLSDMFSKIDWGLIQKPVAFMEAVESGKRIRPETWREDTEMELDDLLYELYSYSSNDIRKLLLGKWYIEGGN